MMRKRFYNEFPHDFSNLSIEELDKLIEESEKRSAELTDWVDPDGLEFNWEK